MFPVDTERIINLSKHGIMNKTKQGYVAPLSELLVVRFEENIMSQASGVGSSGFGSTPNADIDDYSDSDWGW